MKRVRFIRSSRLLLAALVLLLPCITLAQEPTSQDVNEVRTPLATAQGAVFHQSSRPVQNFRIVEVPSTGTAIHLWNEIEGTTAIPHYAISFDGQTIAGGVRSTSYLVRLAQGSFDPLKDFVDLPPNLRAADDCRLQLVQFWCTPLPEFRTELEAYGARIHRFLTDHSYIVEADAATMRELRGLPYVRWTGPLHPAFRVDPGLIPALAGISAPLPKARYSMMVFARGAAMQDSLAEKIRSIGGTVHLTTPEGFRMEATLDAGQLLAVLHMDELQFLDPWGGPGESDMNLVRNQGGANFVESNFGWTGQGVRGEIFDTELQTTHQEWNHTPIIHSSGTSGSNHGTSCYSINFAQGVDGDSRGMQPDGEGIFFLYNESSQFGGPTSRYTILQDLMDPNGPYRAVWQTSSVGSARTTQYTTISAETDDYLFLHQVLSCQSQSNAGSTAVPQDSRPQAWAKNIVSCGGIRHQSTQSLADDAWAGAGSTGPASDGRIKPDLAFWYDGIRAASGSNNTSYTSFGGTSAATPETAGHFGIFFQMWHMGVWPGYGGGSDVFSSRPKMATAKAMLINHAFQYDWPSGGSNGDITRDRQGWGLPNLQKLVTDAPLTTIVDESDVIGPLQVRSYPVNVAGGTAEFRATMVFVDPMGTVGAAQHRVNDLSLRVTAPNGQVYWGNNGLHAGLTSTPGGSSNHVDTVENVFVANPASGTWLVEVIAEEIVQDAHLETSAIDADFALVIHGGPAAPIFHLDVNSTGVQDLSLGMNNIPATANQGYSIFSFNTAGPVGTGPILGINPDLMTLQILGTPMSAGNVFHWTYPVAAPLFPASPFVLPAGSTTPFTGMTIDMLGVAISSGFSFEATPIVRHTFN